MGHAEWRGHFFWRAALSGWLQRHFGVALFLTTTPKPSARCFPGLAAGALLGALRHAVHQRLHALAVVSWVCLFAGEPLLAGF